MEFHSYKWTNQLGEEFGAYGGEVQFCVSLFKLQNWMVLYLSDIISIFFKAYWNKHKEDMLKNYVLVEESDMGTFKPRAIGFTGSPNATRGNSHNKTNQTNDTERTNK